MLSYTAQTADDSGLNEQTSFRLAFRSLFNSGRGFAFPCNEQGQVDMSVMTERAKTNYLFARAMVGRDLCPPAVEMVAAA
jgi:hypothetical protein